MDIYAKPKGVVLLTLMIVEMVDNMVTNAVRKERAKKLAPYIGSIAIYIFISNISGLFGFDPPTSNFSVTFTLALITFVLVQSTAIKTNGVGGYLHGFIEPMPLFVIMNFFGKVAPLISMPMRLFGNILSGGIILSLIYTFTGYLSSLIIPFIGGFNFIGPIIAPVFHAYFDVFAGFIQMFIFITLTIVYIGNELPEE